MSDQFCPNCGYTIIADMRFCPQCGTPLSPPPPIQKPLNINTHSYGWLALTFLISLLWFKLNGNPIFPLGFVGGLIVAYWANDINRAVGKSSIAEPAIALALVGMVIGLIIH